MPFAATQVSSNLEGTQKPIIRQAGSSVQFTCDIKQSVTYVHWYRYQEGIALQRLVYYHYQYSRLTTDPGISSGKYHTFGGTDKNRNIEVRSLEERDSGVYYCAVWEEHSDSDLPYSALKILFVAAKCSLATQDRPARASLPALTSLYSEQRETLSSMPNSHPFIPLASLPHQEP